jgi:hypothetical protein
MEHKDIFVQDTVLHGTEETWNQRTTKNGKLNA